jgi:hypothetical protein
MHFLRHAQTLLTRCANARLKAGRLEVVLEQLRDVGLVFDDQYTRHCRDLLPAISEDFVTELKTLSYITSTSPPAVIVTLLSYCYRSCVNWLSALNGELQDPNAAREPRANAESEVVVAATILVGGYKGNPQSEVYFSN